MKELKLEQFRRMWKRVREYCPGETLKISKSELCKCIGVHNKSGNLTGKGVSSSMHYIEAV